MRDYPRSEVERLEDPPLAKTLFGSVRLSWLWLILRLYLGYEWLMAGLGKLGNPAWTGANAGAAVTGFVQGALQKTAGEHPDVQGWYAWFLQNVVLPNAAVFSFLVTFGEILVGIALIVGIFTGIAAFFGSLMNVSYLLAGTVSVNPVLFAIATWLVLAWKTAGWIGLDRWVLPALGTPWSPGVIFRRRGASDVEEPATIPGSSPAAIPETGDRLEDKRLEDKRLEDKRLEDEPFADQGLADERGSDDRGHDPNRPDHDDDIIG